jgi:CheY-like chemotaxis protein
MRKLKVIIVENDEDEQMFMKAGFGETGNFEILAFVYNGDELFEYLKENSSVLPDVILSDLNMPGKNGYDILTEVKQNPDLSSIPVIITSTSSAKMIKDKCMALGAADYLVKPDTFNEYLPFAQHLYQSLIEKKLA